MQRRSLRAPLSFNVRPTDHLYSKLLTGGGEIMPAREAVFISNRQEKEKDMGWRKTTRPARLGFLAVLLIAVGCQVADT